MERMFSGPFAPENVPGNEWSRERKFHHHHGNEESLVLRTNVPDTVPDTKIQADPPDICYHVKIGSSTTKGVCINRRESPKLGSAWTPSP